MCTAVKIASNNPTSSERAESIHLQAHVKWETGDFRSAVRLMRAAAKLGAYGSKNNLGYMYDLGIGVKKNPRLAMGWYRRAFRAGNVGSATNIGTIYRDEMKSSLALRWFHKAVALGDIDANLDIANLLVNRLNDPKTAVPHLKLVLKAKGGLEVTIHSQEQAAALLKKIERKPSPRQPR